MIKLSKKLDHRLKHRTPGVRSFIMQRVDEAKRQILWHLRNGNCERLDLEAYVISSLNIVDTENGIVHRTKPIHHLAFILAYKELEETEEINIQRFDLPFPMIDNQTLFSIHREEEIPLPKGDENA